jgi:sulfate/thiosulfate transport system substrate-binding protein
VAAGQEADIVHFSIGSDMNRLVEEGRVAASWDKQPFQGIAQDSVSSSLPQGNPIGIHSFVDLLDKNVA